MHVFDLNNWHSYVLRGSKASQEFKWFARFPNTSCTSARQAAQLEVYTGMSAVDYSGSSTGYQPAAETVQLVWPICSVLFRREHSANGSPESTRKMHEVRCLLSASDWLFFQQSVVDQPNSSLSITRIAL